LRAKVAKGRVSGELVEATASLAEGAELAEAAASTPSVMAFVIFREGCAAGGSGLGSVCSSCSEQSKWGPRL
jgi:hypothetical protein